MGINQSTYRFPFAAYPAVRLVLLFAGGLILDYYLDIIAFVWVGVVAALGIGMFLSSRFNREALNTGLYNQEIICYLLLIISFGGAWHALFNHQESPAAARVVNYYTWDDLQFSGKVYRIQPTSTGKYQIDISVDRTVFANQLAWEEEYQLRTTLNPGEVSYPSALELGDRIAIIGQVYPLESPTNPGQFDYKKYLATQGIYVHAGIQEIQQVIPSDAIFSWNRVRQHVLTAVEHNFSDQSASLAKALLIGFKYELDQDTKLAFSRTGLSHIMAVSGLHVGFIIAPFWIVIPFFWGSRNGRRLGLAILIMTLFFYAGLTGFSASVMRASITGGLLAYARLYHKVRDSKNLTAVAALIILLLSPGDLFSIGFQLSFGAVYIILLIAPVVNRKLPDHIRFRWYGMPIMAVIISLIVQIGLFPLLAYYFGEFSLIGPLANAAVVPFLGPIVPYALVLLALSMLWPGLAYILNIPADIFFHQMGRLVVMASGWDWSWIQVHFSGLFPFMLWIIAVFCIASVRIKQLRWKMVILLLMLLTVEQGYDLLKKGRTPQLEITVLDVGQGDATFIRTPKDKYYLVDTGLWQPNYNSAQSIIIPFLESQGITKLNGVFLSHPHADHIGGMVGLLNNISIDTIYTSGSPYDTNLFHEYRSLAARKEVPITTLQAGDQLKLDPWTPLMVYGPEESAHSPSNVNNRSLVFEVVYGNTEFLFMGDAEKKQEKQLYRRYPQLISTDFLKVGHHGSKTSSTQAFLQAAAPQIAVTSLGLTNRFNHPDREATLRLNRIISKLYFTSLSGAIKLKTDGNEIAVEEKVK